MGRAFLKRTLGRKIALGFAIASFLGALVTLVAFVVMLGRYGSADVIVASLLATDFFFASCGIVLYFISQPPRYELLAWDHVEAGTADSGV